MIKEEEANIRMDNDGKYRIIGNDIDPPNTISGNFYKLGHFIKVEVHSPFLFLILLL